MAIEEKWPFAEQSASKPNYIGETRTQNEGNTEGSLSDPVETTRWPSL